MSSVNFNINNRQVQVSQQRIEAFLAGDEKGATTLGSFESFKNFFTGGPKESELKTLFESIKHSPGPDSVARFAALAEHAVDPSALKVQMSGQPNADGKVEVGFLIHNQLMMEPKSVGQQATLAILGQAPRIEINIAEFTPDWMGGHRIDDDEAFVGVTRESFGSGGIHKKVATSAADAPTGLLRAEDSTGEKDFLKESQVNDLASKRAEVRRYVSTQRPLTDAQATQLSAQGLTGPKDKQPKLGPQVSYTKKSYATFNRYKSPPVEQGELDKTAKNLSPNQTRSVLRQAVDMQRVFYKNRVAHNDLHGHNLMTYKNKKDPNNITLKAIDFGKSKVNADVDECRANLKYMFKRTAIGTGDSIRRGARENWDEKGVFIDVDKAAVEKHYPLHRLLARATEPEGTSSTLTQLTAQSDQFNDALDNIGDELLNSLEEAEKIDDPMEKAFNAAGDRVDGLYIGANMKRLEAAEAAKNSAAQDGPQRAVVERSDRNATLETGSMKPRTVFSNKESNAELESRAKQQVERLTKLAKNARGDEGVNLLAESLRTNGHAQVAESILSQHQSNKATSEGRAAEYKGDARITPLEELISEPPLVLNKMQLEKAINDFELVLLAQDSQRLIKDAVRGILGAAI
jgi:hypothetical protein